MSEPSFTGRTRQRTTSRRIVFADKASRFVITTGGIGTILAVVAICVFLVYVAFPLFQRGEFTPSDTASVPAGGEGPGIVAMEVDAFDDMAWTIREDSTLVLRALADMREIDTRRPFGDQPPSAYAFFDYKNKEIHACQVLLGYADGSVRLANLQFEPRFLPAYPEPPGLADLREKQTRVYQGGIAERTPKGQLRLQELHVAVQDPIRRESTSPVRAVDVTVLEEHEQMQPIMLVLGEDGALDVYRTRKRPNLLTGEVTITLTASPVPFEPRPGEPLPDRVYISSLGDVVYVIWDDGRLQRFYRSMKTGEWLPAERLDLLPEEDARITVTGFLVGKESLVVGDSTGGLSVWFRSRPEKGVEAGTPDGFRFVRGHVLALNGPAPTAIAPSFANRVLVTGFADGSLRGVYVTNENSFASVDGGRGPIRHLALSPRGTVVLSSGPGGLRSFRLHAGFPSVTLSSLFLPQWYEGRPGPEYSWQSTGSTNEFEPKMGLMPLITSTLKATFYSLLFGVPIALLAALFTSEFLSARVKVPIKSTIEVMASLPSVVLGFLAALVIAPFAQGTVSAILLSFLAVPVMLLVGAYLWQLLPHATALRLGAGLRFAAMGIAVVAGIALAAALGPSVEKALFWVAAAQEDVTFQASLDQTPPATPPADQTLDDPDVATALRLHAGAPIPEATAGEARRRLERLQRAPVVFHDATWNRRYRPGRDFVLEDLDSSDAAPVPLGAPLLVHRPPGSRIREVTDADTEAERAAKALYVAVGRKPDFEGWLAGRARGPATGGWVLLLLPLSAVVMLVVMGRWVRPWLRKRTVGLGRREVALLDLARYLAGGAATLLLALGLARGFAALGWDLRGNLLGTYVQRNALVVGFVMGFAIIPIIYTLAEDALSSVPSHLREGSLGAGATPWQTATRIVVPTSMSGLFSAVMIGLGRAVGETMIVLMAAGNTPIMDWNPFNGMRTLAANIATELPEADRSSPHYRILFLCALVLFAMTFVVNTFAEAVRIRFRKRTHQL